MDAVIQPKVDIVSSRTAKEVDKMVASAEGPVLQVGSRLSIVDRSPRRWRSLFAEQRPELAFIGLDIAAGDNVDVVADLCADFPVLDAALGGQRFGFILCQHVLEHVADPFQAARNLQRLLREGGQCYVATPWVQAFHAFPNDYWRFSFTGLMQLFPEMKYEDMYYSASDTGFDVAYKILIDGAIDLARTPFEIEAHLFQLVFDKEENRTLTAFREGKKLLLARGYMPVTFVNLLMRKSKGG